MSKPKIYWLASFPKSGNTWCRAFLSNYISNEEKALTINQLDNIPIASSRFFIDDLLGLESSELTTEEIAAFRIEAFKIFHEESKNIQIIKVHDSFPEKNEPSFFTKDITAGVIYIVRNPLDVAVSLAYHLNKSIESSIKRMNNDHFYLCNSQNKLDIQFPQKLGSWSGHVRSWLDYFEGKLHLVRYEDLLDNPQKTFKDLIDFMEVKFDEVTFEKSLGYSSFNFLQEQEKQNGFRERSPHAKAFFREGKMGTWKKYLRDDQIAEIIKHHRDTMQRLNYLDNKGNLLI